MIKFNSISKNFGKLKALSEINFTAETGKTTVLLGQSGCGKSTLIRIVAGLIEADTGSVYVDEVKVNKENINFIRRNLGYVIQEGGLFPHLTAEQNIILAAKQFGISGEKIDKTISNLIELTKFPPDGMTKFPSQLSGGQKQRVSLMRALMLDPKILLLDEPLGALDPLIRFDLQNDLKEIFSKLNKTVLLVTHDLSEAAFFADKIVLIKDGEIVQTGNITELLNEPKNDFVTMFINAQRSVITG